MAMGESILTGMILLWMDAQHVGVAELGCRSEWGNDNYCC